MKESTRMTVIESTSLPFAPLPLGAIRPRGWLLRQLEIQAGGLSGHLDEFWPDVARSAWIGGDRDGWERGPYWLDGLVPLAFLLGDERLIAKADRWVDAILARQHEDGWLGSTNDVRITGSGRVDLAHDYDPWPRFVVLKALTQYQEATGDDRIVPAMLRFLRRLAEVLAERPLRSWGRYRWADLVVSILWLHERTREDWLLDLAAVARDQGFNWPAQHAVFSIRGRCLPEERDLSTHVVNNAMGLKDPGIRYRLDGDSANRAAVATSIETLDRWHGQATGVFSGDEHLAGRNPSQGTELCAVVEYLYSLETLLPILGDAALGDRFERIAFNALPATISADMWTHQYVQQVNQAICAVSEDRVYTSNGPDANIFGLEPHFGCCTANMHQGWPKVVSHLWLRSADDGLAAVSYAPCSVETTVRGAPVRVVVESDYPFDGRVSIVVETPEAVRFPLRLRAPVWADGATLVIDGAAAPLAAGGFHLVEREWSGSTTLVLDLPMDARVERRDDASAVIHRGPLVLAHPVGEEWRKVAGEDPHADWEVHPTTAWNHALVLPEDDPATAIEFASGPLGDVPFGPDAPPVTGIVPSTPVAGWEIQHNAAGPVPASPVAAAGPEAPLWLVPYGSTTLRIAQFPVAE